MSLRTQNTAYWIAWTSARTVLNTFYRTEVYGAKQVPSTGSFILAGNHASFFDPPAFGSCLPREIAYFARKTLFKPGLTERLLRTLNSIPVDRDGDSDVTAFKQVFKVLRGGELGIMLYPEGTRTSNGKLQKAQKGVGLFACKTQVPVIPARIFGSYEAYSRHHKVPTLGPDINIVFGKPLHPADYDPGQADPNRNQVAAERIMAAIGKLEIPAEVGAV